jgi:hypothetical protein
MKNYNFNKFGRYNGGVPTRVGRYRGGANGLTGTVVDAQEMHLIRGAGSSVDMYTNREDMRANTNFYKSDKEYYDYKHTYYQSNVEEFPRFFKTTRRRNLFLYLLAEILIFFIFLKYFMEFKRQDQIKYFDKKGVVNKSDGFVMFK